MSYEKKINELKTTIDKCDMLQKERHSIMFDLKRAYGMNDKKFTIDDQIRLAWSDK